MGLPHTILALFRYEILPGDKENDLESNELCTNIGKTGNSGEKTFFVIFALKHVYIQFFMNRLRIRFFINYVTSYSRLPVGSQNRKFVFLP